MLQHHQVILAGIDDLVLTTELPLQQYLVEPLNHLTPNPGLVKLTTPSFWWTRLPPLNDDIVEEFDEDSKPIYRWKRFTIRRSPEESVLLVISVRQFDSTPVKPNSTRLVNFRFKRCTENHDSAEDLLNLLSHFVVNPTIDEVAVTQADFFVDRVVFEDEYHLSVCVSRRFKNVTAPDLRPASRRYGRRRSGPIRDYDKSADGDYLDRVAVDFSEVHSTVELPDGCIIGRLEVSCPAQRLGRVLGVPLPVRISDLARVVTHNSNPFFPLRQYQFKATLAPNAKYQPEFEFFKTHLHIEGMKAVYDWASRKRLHRTWFVSLPLKELLLDALQPSLATFLGLGVPYGLRKRRL